MKLDFQLARRMSCTKRSKRKAVQLIDILVRFAEEERKEGLLALEDHISGINRPLLRKGLRLVTDGTDRAVVEDVLMTNIFAAGKRGRRLLEGMIMVRGVLAIQSGDNPSVMLDKLFAFLGEDAEELQDQYKKNVFDSRQEAEHDSFMSNDGVCAGILQGLLEYDDKSIQKIMRETDDDVLVAALYGASKEVRRLALGNMSRRAATLIVGACSAGRYTQDEIENSQARIMSILKKLRDAGEIPV